MVIRFKSIALFLGIDGYNKAKQLRILFIAMTRIWLRWVSIFTRISYVSTPSNDGKNSRSKNVFSQYCTELYLLESLGIWILICKWTQTVELWNTRSFIWEINTKQSYCWWHNFAWWLGCTRDNLAWFGKFFTYQG